MLVWHGLRSGQGVSSHFLLDPSTLQFLFVAYLCNHTGIHAPSTSQTKNQQYPTTMLLQGGRIDGCAVQQQRDRLFPLMQTRLSIQFPSRRRLRSQHVSSSSSRMAAVAIPASRTIYVQQPTQPVSPAATAAVPLTWPGLLVALGLAATALFGLAATCFFLYIRPVMQVRAQPHQHTFPLQPALDGGSL